MKPARSEYAALSRVMQDAQPNCEPWPDLFTADDPADGETLKFAAELCRTCPLLKECGDYARAARPAFGIWGGRQHPLKGTT